MSNLTEIKPLKRLTNFFLIFLMIISGCTDFIMQIEKDEFWLSQHSGQVTVHYREKNFSSEPSPDSLMVSRILRQQNTYINRISDSIGMTFNDTVLIYLYNADESHEKIGTKGGGHAIPNFLSFYYVYKIYYKTYTDQYGMVNPPLGAHEMVHVITHHLLGTAGTKLMSEGYAVWLDGAYVRTSLVEIIKWYIKQSEESKILMPSQMLSKTDYAEEIFYPSAGMFVRFLVRRHGIELANYLFNIRSENFIREFEKATSLSFTSMEEDFKNFLKKL